MSVLIAALDESLVGNGQVVALAGEPGIGKTHTSQELAEIARSKGASVLWGRCCEERGAPPTGRGLNLSAPT